MTQSERRASWALVLALVLALGVALALRSRRAPGSAEGALTSAARPAAAARPPGPARPVARASPVRIVPPAATPIAGLSAAPAPEGAFEGRVVSSADGRAVPGALLTFARAEEASSVTAGSDGAFRFDVRVRGRWSLAAVTAPGFLPFAPAWGASPVSLEARAGEVVRGVTIALAPEVQYQGRVVDGKDRPVAGAAVRILGERGADALVALRDRFTSDSEGRFSFAAPEDAVLEARKEGFAPARERVTFAVRVSEGLTLRLAPEKAGLLAIGGTIFDGGGAPLAGASVVARSQATPDEAAARSGADGRFRLEGITPGTWGIVAERAGLAPAATEALAGATDVKLTLAAGGRVQGRVRDRRTAKPVAPFSVIVLSLNLRSVAVIDPAGRYAIDDLPPGSIGLSVVAPGYAPSPEVRVEIPAPDAGVAQADFDLAPGGRLTGVVRSRGSRDPVAGARVEVEGMPASSGVPVRAETMTDSDGRFELAGVSEQATSLFVSGPRHHARVLSVPGVSGGETAGPIELELTPLKEGEEPRVELAGIGVTIARDGEVLRLLHVIAGGGAAEAGLAPGDEIVSIEGTPVAKLTMTEIMPLLRGPEGTTVTVGTVKAGDASRAPRQVVVPRRLVRG